MRQDIAASIDWTRVAQTCVWGLVVLVLVALALLLLRKPISDAIKSRTLRVKRGTTELETGPASVSYDPVEIGPDMEAYSATPESSAGPAEISLTSSTDSQSRKEMFEAYENKDPVALREAYRCLADTKRSSRDQLEDEALLYALLTALDEPDALRELERLHETAPGNLAITRFLAYTYERYGDHTAALETTRAAAEMADTDEDRAHLLVLTAQYSQKLGDKQDALLMLRNGIAASESPNARSILYRALGDAHSEDKDLYRAALAYEKALCLRPRDKDTRFSSAYAYANTGFAGLAAECYRELLIADPDHGIARNNLGVAYDSLEMPINAVKEFRRSAELDETLAMANLAGSYTEAGFADEAETTLDAAAGLPKVNDAVYERREQLIKAQAAEKARLERVRLDAQLARPFLREIADIELDLVSFDNRLFSGVWQDDAGRDYKLTIGENGVSEITYEQAGEPYRLLGDIHKERVRFTIERGAYFTFGDKEPYGFVRRGTAFIRPSSSGDGIDILLLHDNKPAETLSLVAREESADARPSA